VDLGDFLHPHRIGDYISDSLPKGLSMLFFGPALFGAGCACWIAGVTALYGALLLPLERKR
jgi:hypothetical protein